MAAIDLMPYLPAYFHDIYEFKELLATEGEELGALRHQSDSFLNQMSISTATWGVANWESELGLATDLSKPIEQRRSVIRSRLRGVGTVNKALIKNVAESYVNGEVEVTGYDRNYFHPSFEGWMLNTNATIIGEYELKLIAAAAGNVNTYDKALIPGAFYTFSIERNEGTVRIDSFDIHGFKTSLDGHTWDSIETYKWAEIELQTFDDITSSLNGTGGIKTFVVPSDSAFIRISITSLDNASTGIYTYKNMMLIRGKAADLPSKFEPNKSYMVGIIFVSSLGVPVNIVDMQKALRDIIPAHLDIDYSFTFTRIGQLKWKTIGEITAAGLTFKQLETWEVT